MHLGWTAAGCWSDVRGCCGACADRPGKGPHSTGPTPPAPPRRPRPAAPPGGPAPGAAALTGGSHPQRFPRSSASRTDRPASPWARFRTESHIYRQMRRNLFGIYITLWQFLLTPPSPSISLGRGENPENRGRRDATSDSPLACGPGGIAGSGRYGQPQRDKRGRNTDRCQAARRRRAPARRGRLPARARQQPARQQGRDQQDRQQRPPTRRRTPIRRATTTWPTSRHSTPSSAPPRPGTSRGRP